MGKQKYEYEETYNSIPEQYQEKGLSLEEAAEHNNLAEELSDELLNWIAREAIECYQNDKASRQHREENIQKATKLALQVASPKNFPWPKAANTIFPLITEAALDFGKRAYPSIINDDKIVKAKILGNDDGIPLINPQTGEPIFQLDPMGNFIIGEGGQPIPMWLLPPRAKKNMGEQKSDKLNRQFMEGMPDWVNDTRRLCYMLPVAGNLFRKIYRNSSTNENDSRLITTTNFIVPYETASLANASHTTEIDYLESYEIIENIRRKVFLDHQFPLSGGSQENPEKEAQNEMNEIYGGGFTSDNGPYTYLYQQKRIDLDGDGYPEPYIVTICEGLEKVVRIVANYEKDGIERQNGEIVKIKPEQSYVKYGFLPSFDGGFYDLGYGELLLHLNETSNSIINRLLDAGTLASTSTGFMAKGIRMKGGNLRTKPGEFHLVDTRGLPLRENIVPFPHTQPSPVLQDLLRMLIEEGKSIGNAKSSFSPQDVSSLSGISILQLVEQGMMGFKEIYSAMLKSLSSEIKILDRLNELYDEKVEGQETKLEGIDVIPCADGGAITDIQNMARAQFLEAFKDDPFFNPIETRKRLLKWAKIEDGEELLMMPQPPAEEGVSPDTLVEMQLQNESKRLENEGQRIQNDRIKTAIDAEKTAATIAKTDAEINKLKTESLKNIAETEAVEIGSQMEQYKQAYETLSEENTEYIDDTRTI